VAKETGRETLGFQAEIRQLLKLMVHSLYSNKEIFLRELISNASDAVDKLRFEALAAPALLGEDAQLGIRILSDKDAATITVIDNGIGMSRDEIIEHLGTIARSGTAEFLQRLTGDQQKDAQLIGQFGVGFYSAFIVADSVVVETRRAGLDAGEGVRWQSDGQGEFTVERIERPQRGTSVTLHLKDTETEFAEPLRIENLIRRYSDHIAFPVTLEAAGGKGEEAHLVNAATALWTRPRADVTDDEYREFYKHLAHDFAEPLTWSHNRVEGKREYTTLLYIPSHAPFDLWNRDAPKGLKLYVQRVFIMDDVEQFLPLYLRFVKGIVDSSDLPLNVSRELLQQNAELAAMRGALTRRVLDMLEKLATDTPDDYIAFWKEFGQVLKEGVVEDRANKDRVARLLRFSTTHGEDASQDQSLDDYLGRADGSQDVIYYLLADSHATAASSPLIESLSRDGVEVLLLTDRIDAWVVESLAEYDGKKLQDVARADIPLPGGDGQLTQQVLDDEHKPLLKKIKKILKDRVEAVQVSRRLVDSAACVVASENQPNPQLRRILEAAGQTLPETPPILEVNVSHPLVARLAAESDQQHFAALSNILLDHALLAEGAQLRDPAEYVRRMNSLLLELDSHPGPG
jgi:molecular chaperone HtpG